MKAFVLFFILLPFAAMADICQVHLSRATPDSKELVVRAGDMHAGYLYYRMVNESLAVVNLVSIQDEFKGRGFSKALFHGMLALNPEIKQVEAILVGDNFSATNLRGVRHTVTHEQCEAAFRRSPFYKAWARLGFGIVGMCEFHPHLQAIEVEVLR
jgi:hypothetical protein